MKVRLVVLTELKLADNRHPKSASGYTIMCSKAVSGHQGGVTLLWKENNPKFEVKSVLFNNGPNIVTFQVTMGDERFYVIRIYVPPRLQYRGRGLAEGVGRMSARVQANRFRQPEHQLWVALTICTPAGC